MFQGPQEPTPRLSPMHGRGKDGCDHPGLCSLDHGHEPTRKGLEVSSASCCPILAKAAGGLWTLQWLLWPSEAPAVWLVSVLGVSGHAQCPSLVGEQARLSAIVAMNPDLPQEGLGGADL